MPYTNLEWPLLEGFGKLTNLIGILCTRTFSQIPCLQTYDLCQNWTWLMSHRTRLVARFQHICKLEYILALDNEFIGQVLESYGDCNNMLHLCGNKYKLRRRIPKGIWKFPHDSILDLNFNILEGEISIPIGNVRNLSKLYP